MMIDDHRVSSRFLSGKQSQAVIDLVKDKIKKNKKLEVVKFYSVILSKLETEFKLFRG